MEELLPAISCPLLLLQADPAHGGLMTEEEIVQARRLLPALRHVQVAGVSHALHHTHKEPVLDELIQFLKWM